MIRELDKILTEPSVKRPWDFKREATDFFKSIPHFRAQLNEIIIRINKAMSRIDQSGPIPIYDSEQVYNFPDPVVCSDGNTYRCIGEEISGIDPTGNPDKWKITSYDPAIQSSVTGSIELGRKTIVIKNGIIISISES